MSSRFPHLNYNITGVLNAKPMHFPTNVFRLDGALEGPGTMPAFGSRAARAETRPRGLPDRSERIDRASQHGYISESAVA